MKHLVLIACVLIMVGCGLSRSIANNSDLSNTYNDMPSSSMTRSARNNDRAEFSNLLSNTFIQYPGKMVKTIEFKPLLDGVPNGEIKLANGTIVSGSDWDAVLVTTFVIDEQNKSYCTATVIGPNVVLTAAHCVDDGTSKSMPASINIAGIQIQLECFMHPNWIAAGAGFHIKDDADYAICLASREIASRNKEIGYENVDMQQLLGVNDTVILTGYGCINVGVTTSNELTYENSEGILRIGSDEIHANDYGSNSGAVGTMALTYSPQNTEPTLCPGDSGGPVFKSISDNKRSVVAVNSAVGWNGTGTQADFYSILAPLASPVFTSFLEQWMNINSSARICGYNVSRGTKGCKI